MVWGDEKSVYLFHDDYDLFKNIDIFGNNDILIASGWRRFHYQIIHSHAF